MQQTQNFSRLIIPNIDENSKDRFANSIFGETKTHKIKVIEEIKKFQKQLERRELQIKRKELNDMEAFQLDEENNYSVMRAFDSKSVK